MDREQQSARGAMQREEIAQRLEQAEKENQRLRDTVIGLGALVAQAHAAGFVQAREK